LKKVLSLILYLSSLLELPAKQVYNLPETLGYYRAPILVLLDIANLNLLLDPEGYCSLEIKLKKPISSHKQDRCSK